MTEPAEELSPNDLGRMLYHYRMAGDSLEEIAAKLAITLPRAAKLYHDYLTDLARYGDAEKSDQAKAMEMARLDALQHAYWGSAMAGDINSGKYVLEIMKHRAKLGGWEDLNAKDQAVVHSVLVVGNDQAAFLAALQEGRNKPELAGYDPDNDVEGTVEDGMGT